MKSPPRARQRGVALLVLLLVLSLGGMWYLVTGMQQRSTNFTAASRTYNARVLSQAKAAVMGYVAHQAAVSGENNPGAFLCPEAVGNIGTANEGVAASNCALPAVGRLPWKTIGIDKLLDVRGEPLWYVVASGWAKPNSTTNTIINSNCTDATSAMTCYTGQLTVDGQANAAVALIIAPGAAMNVAASAGCTARNQSRNAPSPTINPLDYLECYNGATFVTSGASTSFNDQVVKITAAEILPLIEGAIADRFQKEFATQMKTAYSAGLWSAGTVEPFAVPFGDPTTSNFQGVSGTRQGLLPASYAFNASPGSSKACSPAPCTPTPCTPASDARCAPGFVNWQNTAVINATGGRSLATYSCSVTGTPSTLTCNIYSTTPLVGGFTFMTFTLDATASNVGMALRQINATVPITGVDTVTVNPPYGYSVVSGTLASDGSATIRLSSRLTNSSGTLVSLLSDLTSLCLLNTFTLLFNNNCYKNTISVPMALFSDHPLVDPNIDSTTGVAANSSYNWFFRNRWHEVTYYAVASGIVPGGGGSCTTGSTCLQLNYSADAGKHRAVLIIGGQKLATKDAGGNPYAQVRPATQVKDLLDDVNAAGTSPFEVRSASLTPNRGFNDHFAVIDKNP